MSIQVAKDATHLFTLLSSPPAKTDALPHPLTCWQIATSIIFSVALPSTLGQSFALTTVITYEPALQWGKLATN